MQIGGSITMEKCPICGSIVNDQEECCSCCGAILKKASTKHEQKTIKSDVTNNAERVLRSVVKITTEIGIGTGFVYDGNLVITNAHVVLCPDEDGGLAFAQNIKATFSEKIDKKVYMLKILNVDVKEDIAVLAFYDYVHFPSLKLFHQNTKMGEEVFTIGCPLGYDFSYVLGHVSNPEKVVSHKINRVIQTDMTINHGNSGGPLCNQNCEVVGIMTFNELHASNDHYIDTPDGQVQVKVTKPVDGMSFAVTSLAIQEFLQTMKR